MVQSLMHKWIMEDSTKCFTAMPDYVLIFTKHKKSPETQDIYSITGRQYPGYRADIGYG